MSEQTFGGQYATFGSPGGTLAEPVYLPAGSGEQAQFLQEVTTGAPAQVEATATD